MGNEQQRVDVLAMLDLARAVAERDGLQGDAQDYAKAHAAVAGLIEAAKDVDAGSGGCPCPTCERLRKALANVGAAK